MSTRHTFSRSLSVALAVALASGAPSFAVDGPVERSPDALMKALESAAESGNPKDSEAEQHRIFRLALDGYASRPEFLRAAPPLDVFRMVGISATEMTDAQKAQSLEEMRSRFATSEGLMAMSADELGGFVWATRAMGLPAADLASLGEQRLKSPTWNKNALESIVIVDMLQSDAAPRFAARKREVLETAWTQWLGNEAFVAETSSDKVVWTAVRLASHYSQEKKAVFLAALQKRMEQDGEFLSSLTMLMASELGLL